MSHLYNEIDPYAAQWLRNLTDAKHLPQGRVEERSIKELTSEDLTDIVQFHTFAGIGVWPYALRAAGWPEDREVWTGSCPCQPFSAAGRKAGVSDPRHLWPDWFRLIEQRRPAVVLGEQVASPDGLAWLDAVQSDMEGAGYAFAAFDLCAAGFGAPHIRQRLYFAAIRLADPDRIAGGQGSQNARWSDSRGDAEPRTGPRSGRGIGGLADDDKQRLGQFGSARLPENRDASPGHDAHRRRASDGVANADECEREGDLDRGSAEGEGSPRSGIVAQGGNSGPTGRLGDANGEHPGRNTGAGHRAEGGAGLRGSGDDPRASGPAGRLGFAGFAGFERLQGHGGHENARRESGRLDSESARPAAAPGPTNGHWSGADWLLCRDGKWRPTEPGLFPLAHGATQRVGRLKAYGNGLVAPQAIEFIEAVMEFLDR